MRITSFQSVYFSAAKSPQQNSKNKLNLNSDSFQPRAQSSEASYLSVLKFGALSSLEKKFLKASTGGKTEVMSELLKASIDVNCADQNGHTALHLAAMHGQKDAVELLLKQPNIDKDKKDLLNSSTPYDIAWIHTYTEICNLLRPPLGNITSKAVNVPNKP